jgi:pimeloyl-ACP methyl ester carboxylesterase
VTSSPLGLREPDRTALLEVNRTRLRVWDWGDPEAPVVLCAPGAHDHGRRFGELAPALAESLGARVVAVDLRGHGDSGRLSSGHVWLATSLDLVLLARQLGGGRPVGLVGHSFGAGLSMFTASVWPEVIPWVVNLDGLGGGGGDGDGPPDDWDLAEDVVRSFASAERTLLSPPRRYASRADMVERRAGVNHRLPRAWVEHLVLHGAVETEGGWEWKADPVFRTGFPGDWDAEYDEAERAERVPFPVLVLTGAEDDTWSDHTPEVVARRVAGIPGARHEVVADAGHYVHIEQPEVVLESIVRFVKDLGGVR